jgi:nucleotide-binding universal stress UspA family protein
MQTPNTPPVVVGVNGTAAGLAAVRFGAREAVARRRRLVVVHAFTWPDSRYGADKQAYAPARRSAHQIVEQAVAAARRSTPGVAVAGRLVEGPPARVMRQQSRAAELLIVGDDDLGAGSALPIDSVLLQTVSRSFCPVVVARGLRPPTGPLLAAIDGSPSSQLALRHAAAEATRRGIGVDVVHVVEDPGREEAGRRLLAAATATVPKLARARQRLLIGDPATALIRASRHARMVVVGPRGRDGAALLGPVAQALLRRCACPTLFVHGTTAAGYRPEGTAPTAQARAG